MNKYEVTYIVETTLGEDATTALVERLIKTIEQPDDKDY